MNQRFSSIHLRGACYGLGAATLFGVSPPLAKLLLPAAGPLVIASLLYLGAGLGLLAFEHIVPLSSAARPREAPIRPSDRWLLAGIVLTGGMIGPILMLWGLQRLSAVMSSLLLNLEAPFTILLAVVLFREHLGRLEATGALLICAAAAVLTYRPGEVQADVWGGLALVGACLSWAVDNNLTQRISLRDPIVVTRIKALGAGAGCLILALLTQQVRPSWWIIGTALLLGLVSYGVSLVLDTLALRYLGAAREAGYFAMAPFIGAVTAVPILGERWGAAEFAATAVMASGLYLLIREHHSHLHVHEAMEHEHAHTHGDHHEHAHEREGLVLQPHSHLHRHRPLMHDHPHVSELHHRHEHD